jgi:hypothetical protein
MSREVMQQALEALETYLTMDTVEESHLLEVDIAPKAINALRAALAEPEPRNQCGETCERAKLCAICTRGLEEPKQNTVTCVCGAVWDGEQMVHAPRKREWVGLTDEEVMVAAYQAGFDIHEDYDNEDDPEKLYWWSADGEASNDSLLKLRDFIEAKLKEKNQ